MHVLTKFQLSDTQFTVTLVLVTMATLRIKTNQRCVMKM